MAGYAGYSMSNNAVAAYEEGAKPLSKFRKQDFVNYDKRFKSFKFQELKDFMESYGEDGWHHTSKFYNKTYFYSFESLEITSKEDNLTVFDFFLKERREEEKKIQAKRENTQFCRIVYEIYDCVNKVSVVCKYIYINMFEYDIDSFSSLNAFSKEEKIKLIIDNKEFSIFGKKINYKLLKIGNENLSDFEICKIYNIDYCKSYRHFSAHFSKKGNEIRPC